MTKLSSMIWTAGIFAVAYQFITFLPAMALVLITPQMSVIYVMALSIFATGLALVLILSKQGVADDVMAPGDVTVSMAIVTIISIIATFIVVGIVTGLLSSLFGSEGLAVDAGFRGLIDQSPFIGLMLAVVLIGPVVEELIYRGLLMGVLLARGWTPVAAVCLSALVFAVQHIQYGWIGMVSIMIYGIALGMLRVAGGGLFAPILAHVIINAISVSV